MSNSLTTTKTRAVSRTLKVRNEDSAQVIEALVIALVAHIRIYHPTIEERHQAIDFSILKLHELVDK